MSLGTFAVVFALALLLRMGYAPQILSTIHLTTSLLAAWIIIEGTGGIYSPFSFLYLLVVLDAAIIGSLKLSLLLATLSFCFFTSHLLLKYLLVAKASFDLLSLKSAATPLLSHLFGVYLLAILAGRLAKLLEYAEQEALSMRSDLAELSYQHTAILESLPLGVLTFDNNDCIKMVNQAASIILEQSKSELIGSKLTPSIRKFIRQSGGNGELQIDNEECTRTLKLTCATFSLQTQINSELQDRLRVLVFEDATQIRALEDKFRMQDRLASIGELAASIAHEIRNPLAAISGAIQLLEKDESASPEDKKLQNIVHREIERLNALISDFLNYARPPSPNLTKTNLQELCNDVVFMLEKDERFLNNNIETAFDTKATFAHVDKEQMQQVLWNLLMNALEASQGQEKVKLTLETSGAEKKSSILIKVFDSGPGVSKDIRERIFEPFVTDKVNGTGLGLAMAHRAVLAHRGSIEILDNQPSGSIFVISLPLSA